MEKTFEECCDEVAKKKGFDSLKNYLQKFTFITLAMSKEAAELYAKSQQTKVWEDACDEVKRIYDNSLDFSVEESVEETKKCNPYKP